jgi:NADH-quinone oxidoreductase subunit N
MITLTLLYLLVTNISPIRYESNQFAFKSSLQQYCNNYNIVLISLIALIVQTIYTRLYGVSEPFTVFNIFTIDSLIIFVIAISSLLAIWLITNINQSSYSSSDFSLMLIILLGIFALCSSNSILSALICIEVQSLGMYILLGLNGSNYQLSNIDSSTANNGNSLGITYLLNAATATAILILGISINSGIIVITSLIWKLGGYPLHNWLMPIVDNLTSHISALVLTLTKLGIVVYLAIISTSLAHNTYVLILSVFNLMVGSIISIFQYRYLLLFSWLSLAQLGYVLTGIGLNVTTTAIIYFALYSIYTTLALLAFNYSVFTKYITNYVYLAVLTCLIITFFSLAGLPYVGLF